ncbi:hypothetical protein NDU88_009553 [Pleurodeles waltl]|uniref:Uncharacterized protein n=1 Tax=Pleurodeles waltl TaxID=8319 RepID=A0AAV7RYS6_PLEWA|nr:hypothetical protein NDU88_009553 [Pleurodeles waltl]
MRRSAPHPAAGALHEAGAERELCEAGARSHDALGTGASQPPETSTAMPPQGEGNKNRQKLREELGALKKEKKKKRRRDFAFPSQWGPTYYPVHVCPLTPPLPMHPADNEEGQRTRETVKHQEPRRSMERQVCLLTTSYTLLLDTLPYLLDIACLPPHVMRPAMKESLVGTISMCESAPTITI